MNKELINITCTIEELENYTLREIEKWKEVKDHNTFMQHHYGFRKRFAQFLLEIEEKNKKALNKNVIAEITSLKLQSLPVKRNATGVTK